MPTMDFAYDLKETLEKKGYQYVMVFMQLAKKRKEGHFDVIYKIDQKSTIKVFDSAMQEATQGFGAIEGNSEIKSQKHFMHYYAARFKEQGFDYVLFAAKMNKKHPEKVSIFFNVRNGTTAVMMAEALGEITAAFQKSNQRKLAS